MKKFYHITLLLLIIYAPVCLAEKNLLNSNYNTANSSVTYIINYGQSIELKASWTGTYEWENMSDTTSSIYVSPGINTKYIVRDKNRLFSDTFNVYVNLVILRGPYLQKVSPTSITIKWRTNNPTNSRVYYGEQFMIQSQYTDSSQITTDHTVRLSGLKPNTKYYYSVGHSTARLQGDLQNYFKTMPLEGKDGKYVFWVTGDCGNNSINQRNVLHQYNKYAGDSITNGWLLLGDNAYQSGQDHEYTNGFFNIYQHTIMKHTPIFPSPGNHDYNFNENRPQEEIPYFSIFDVPAEGEAGGVASHNKAYYSYNYGNIHFLSLDSFGKEDSLTQLYDTLGPQAQWVKKDLAANRNKWTIAYWHHPPYTMGSHNSDWESDLVKMRTNFITILERNGVDLIMCGHSHDYERSKLMKGHYGFESSFNPELYNISQSSGKYDGSENSCTYIKDTTRRTPGTVYVVSGSAGKVGGEQAGYPHDAMPFSDATHGGSFMFQVEGDRLDAKWLCSDGIIRDQFTIIKKSTKAKKIKINQGQRVELKASWKGNYQWEHSNTASRTVLVAPSTNRTYIVWDKYECISDTFHISVEPNSVFTNPGSETLLNIFPSPVSDEMSVQLELLEPSDVKIELVSQDGKVILLHPEKKLSNGPNSIFINRGNFNIPAGVYLMKVTSNGNISSSKIIFL